MRIRITILFLMYFLFGAQGACAQESSVAILNEEVIGLGGYSKEGFDKIYPHIQDCKIIGLGEATHGTQDFNLARIALIKYLIEYHELKTIVFEAQFSRSQQVNDYFIDGKGSADSVLLHIINGFWNTQNMRDFLKWVKDYNQHQSAENKVRYFGCDIYAPQYSLNHLKHYLKATGQIDSSLTGNLDWFMERTPSHFFSKEEKRRLHQIEEDLNGIFDGISLEEGSELSLILHYKRLFEQYLEMLRTRGGYAGSVKRDQFLAENVAFIYRYSGQSKMIVWAHNSHLARKSGHEKIKPLGSYLSANYGSDYYVLATAFNKGSFYAFDKTRGMRKPITVTEATEKSFDRFFSQCRESNFYLDLQNNRIPELDKRSYSRNVGSVHSAEKNRNYRRHTLTESYDGILFFEETVSVEYLPLR